MAPDAGQDVLVAELSALGRDVPPLPVDERLVAAVMARLPDVVPTPSGPRLLARRATDALALGRRRLAVAVAVLLVALLAAPPVRAAVADWFGFAGVVVRDGPGPGPSVAPPPPAAGTTTSLEEAAGMVAFEPVVPAALGEPDGVEVSADRRLLSMSWAGGPEGPIRLDQFDGGLDFTFAKTAPGVEFTSVAGDFALWFDEPHELVVLGPDGRSRTETARLAGQTLIWQYGATAVRLEGDLGHTRAVEIAESVAPAR
jgi:hypothetical protein